MVGRLAAGSAEPNRVEEYSKNPIGSGGIQSTQGSTLPKAGLLVEIIATEPLSVENIDQIWKPVEEANEKYRAEARIAKSNILVTHLEKPLPGDGTVSSDAKSLCHGLGRVVADSAAKEQITF